MDVLSDLLKIKIFREEKAEHSVAKAARLLREAEQEVQDSKQELKKYQIECNRKENEMFKELCTRLVFLKEIDNVRIDIQLMKEKEDLLKERLEAAEASRLEAHNQLLEARVIHQAAVRMREKYSEMIRLVQEEKSIEILRFEDLELEEATSSRYSHKKVNIDDESEKTFAS